MRRTGRIGGRGWTHLVAAAALFAAACSNRPPDDPKQYAERIAVERAAKDAEFQRSNDVVPKDKKAQFLPLAYFPIDPDYHVVAGLKPATEQTSLMMPTSSGQMRKMIRLGTLEFTLKP